MSRGAIQQRMPFASSDTQTALATPRSFEEALMNTSWAIGEIQFKRCGAMSVHPTAQFPAPLPARVDPPGVAKCRFPLREFTPGKVSGPGIFYSIVTKRHRSPNPNSDSDRI